MSPPQESGGKLKHVFWKGPGRNYAPKTHRLPWPFACWWLVHAGRKFPLLKFPALMDEKIGALGRKWAAPEGILRSPHHVLLLATPSFLFIFIFLQCREVHQNNKLNTILNTDAIRKIKLLLSSSVGLCLIQHNYQWQETAPSWRHWLGVLSATPDKMNWTLTCYSICLCQSETVRATGTSKAQSAAFCTRAPLRAVPESSLAQRQSSHLGSDSVGKIQNVGSWGMAITTV